MKKRLFSAIIAVVMILPMFLFSGCSSSDNTVVLSGSSVNPMTLTLYSIKGDKTTDEAVQKVEDEINRITEADFNTHIILRMFTEEEYSKKLEEDLAVAEENYVPVDDDETKGTGDASDTTKKVTEEITEPKETLKTTTAAAETDENGETKRVVVRKEQVAYPAENGTQCDIFLLTNVDDFHKYVNENVIQTLSGELLGKSALITKYVNPTLISSANVLDNTFAVSDNKLIGDYEYVLMKKSVADQYSYSEETVHTLAQIQQFASITGSKIVDTYGIEPQAAVLGEGNLLGYYVGYNPKSDVNAIPKNLLTNTKYQDDYTIINTMLSSGTMTKASLENSAGADCLLVKGGADIPELYGNDYYVSVYKYPTVTNEIAFGGAYAVSTYTKSVTRCMQIVTYMQTNEEFANILRYGVSGVNYTKNDEDFVTILNHDYEIKPEYAGNMFLHYQNNEMTKSELLLSDDNWKLGKKQNLDAVADPYLGFSAVNTISLIDSDGKVESKISSEDMMKSVTEESAKYKKQIQAYTASDVATYFNTLGEAFEANENVKAAISTKYSNSPLSKYVAWYEVKFNSENNTNG